MAFGGNPITWAELFDFSNNKEIKGAIKDLEKLTVTYESFAKVVSSGALGMFAQQQKDIADAVKLLVESSKELNITNKESQKILLQNAQKLQEYDAILQRLNETKKKVKQTEEYLSDSVNGLNQKLKKQLEEYNNLSKAEALTSEKGKQLSIDIATTRNEIKLLTDATKANVNTFVAAKGSYDALDRETKKLIKDLHALEGGMNSNSREAVNLKKQIADNTKRLKEFDAQIGQNFRNVGNYGSAFSGLTGQLKTYATGLITITALTQGITFAFNKSLSFDATKRSIEFVSGSAIEADRNLRFLRSTAEELGLDFEGLASGFKTFAAATKDTNLQGEQTRRIFRAVSEAAAVLKISTDDVNGVLRALGQIVSKGKVQAEELRGQLGDRLSGAFQLFAKGLGISTQQLDEFLKKGQITSDALIPFADQLEKTFGPGVANNVNSLQSAVNRLGNTFDTLFQSDSLSNFFAGLISGANKGLRALLNLDEQAQKLAVSSKSEALSAQLLVDEYEKLSSKVNTTTEEKTRLNTIVSTLVGQFGNSVVEINKETGALTLNIQATKDLITQKLLLANDKAAEDAQKYKKAIDDQAAALSNASISQTAYNNLVKQTGRTYNDVRKTLQDAFGSPANLAMASDEALNKVLSKEERALLSNYEATKKYKTEAKYAGESAKEFANNLNELGFTIDDVNKLLNPTAGPTPTITPFGAGDSDKAARELARKLKAAQDVLKATEKLLIEQAKLEYEQGQHTVENQIELERKIYDIRLDSINKQKSLFKKGTEEYIKLQAEEADATKDKLQKIEKLIEEYGKREQKRRDDLDKRLKERREAQRAVASAQAEGNMITESSNIELDLQRSKGEFFSGNNNEWTAYERQYKLRQRAMQETIRMRQEELDNLRVKLGEAADLDKDYLNKKKELIDAENNLKKESADYGIAQAQREAEAKQAVYAAAVNFANEISDAFFETQIERAAAEVENLQKQKEYELSIAGKNATAKQKINDNYDRELRKARRKQSQAEKDAAIFSATVNTVAGAVRALYDYPYPYNLIVAALVGAAGAVQIASIASKELPEYWKGRDNGPEEWALINERGAEIIEEKGGKKYIAGGGKKTVHKLKAGDKVHTHDDSIEMIEKMTKSRSDATDFIDSLLLGTGVYRQTNDNKTEMLASAVMKSALTEEQLSTAFSKAIDNITIHQTIMDERGFSEYNKKKNTRAEIFNNRQKFGGKG